MDSQTSQGNIPEDVIKETDLDQPLSQQSATHSSDLNLQDFPASLHNETKVLVQTKVIHCNLFRCNNNFVRQIIENLTLENLKQCIEQQNIVTKNMQQSLIERLKSNDELQNNLQIDSLQFADLRNKIQNSKYIFNALKNYIEVINRTINEKRTEMDLALSKIEKQKNCISQYIQTLITEYNQLKEDIKRKEVDLQQQQKQSPEINVIVCENVLLKTKIADQHKFLMELKDKNHILQEEKISKSSEINKLTIEREILVRKLEEIKNELTDLKEFEANKQKEHEKQKKVYYAKKNANLKGFE